MGCRLQLRSQRLSLIVGLSALFVVPCYWLFLGSGFGSSFWKKLLVIQFRKVKKSKAKLENMARDEIDKVSEHLAQTNVDEDEEREVTFAGRGLKLDTEADATVVVNEINNCPNMTTLCMEGNTLGVDAAKAIAKSLERQSKFKRALWKDMFTGRLKTEIPDALEFLSSGIILAGAHLYELDLSDNAFGPVGVKSIVTLLKSSACQTLKELRLNNNGLGITGGKLLAQVLQSNVDANATNSSKFALKTFICGRNRLENPGAQALAAVFKGLGSLEDVQMPQNGIYHEGISALAEALSNNPNLKVINFNDNTFTEKGAEAFAKNMANLQELEVINLGDCLLKTRGALAIADAIKDGHVKLKELHLGFNEIQKEGGIALAEAMENKMRLQRLELNGNSFGSEGCQMIEGTMEAVNLASQLGDMSDDDGGVDDEEEESDDQGEEDYEDDDRDQSQDAGDVVEVIDKENQKPAGNGVIMSPKISIDEFLSCPNAGKFLQLGNNRVDLLIGKLESINDPTTKDCLELFVKVSSCLSDTSDGETKNEAFQTCDKFLETAFVKANQEHALVTLTNDFLVHLGLIKSEDKTFTAVMDLKGPFLALEHCCVQPYFAKATKETLQFFLSQPNRAVEQCGKIKHNLMRALFQM